MSALRGLGFGLPGYMLGRQGIYGLAVIMQKSMETTAHASEDGLSMMAQAFGVKDYLEAHGA